MCAMTTSPSPSPVGPVGPTTAPAAPTPPGGGADGIFQRLDTCQTFPYTRREYARRAAWVVVRATLFRLSPARAFRWRAALLRLFGARLGPRVFVRRTCHVFHPWLLET